MEYLYKCPLCNRSYEKDQIVIHVLYEHDNFWSNMYPLGIKDVKCIESFNKRFSGIGIYIEEIKIANVEIV